jgi:hypothetical protein
MVVGKLEIQIKEIQKKNVDLVFLIVILFMMLLKLEKNIRMNIPNGCFMLEDRFEFFRSK